MNGSREFPDADNECGLDFLLRLLKSTAIDMYMVSNRSCNHNAVLPESWREKEMFDMNLSWKRLGNSSSDRENVMPEFTWRNITPENQHYFFLKAEFPKAAPLMG
ncbi:hypothetical protein V6N12_026150 [Hibiscus sabdariffa]|uniref:Uncharacterized protein n=1 Tax=Hibiscus sabdariffa TaxID=183260 RepID=A0ABR2DR73_9ROSI